MSDVIKVKIYSIDFCPYCERAKSLLEMRKVPFKEIKIDRSNSEEVRELFSRSGMKTFPQIFADDRLIGGYTDLAKEDEQDQLASLL